MKKNKISYLITFTTLGLVFASAGCNKSSAVHEHDFEFHGEEPSTCHTEGHEAYNVCKTCEKMFDLDGNEISAPQVLELDPNEHEHTKTLVIESGYKADYTIGDTFDLENSNFKWKCDLCEGVALVSSAKASLTVTYPTAGATCFTAQDAAKESVEVKIASTTFETTATVSVNKKDNAILGFEDMEGHCGLSITYLDSLSTSSRSSQTVKYAIKAPGETSFKAREEFADDYVFVNANKDKTPTVFEVKAYVDGTDEYVAASSTKRLTITHNDLVWDTSREDYDYVGCLCSPEDVTTFNKEVTGIQELVISGGTGSINLNGSSYDSDCVVKSISLETSEETLNLGIDLNAISLAVLGEKEVFGDQTLNVVVSTPAKGDIPACDHTLKVKVNVVTALISNADEWKNNLIPTEQGTIKGYFKVTSDMTLSYYPTWISGWDKCKFGGVIDGQNHKITLGQGTYGQFYFLEGATIKNMTIHNNWWRRIATSYHLLANKSIGTTFENLTFDVPVMGSGEKDEYEVGLNYGYLFGNGGAQRNAFKNCSWDFGNYILPSLLGHSPNSTQTNTFENSTLKCKDYQELYFSNEGAVLEAEGLTILTNASVELKIPAQELDSKAATNSITLPAEYASSTILDAYFIAGGASVSVGTNLSSIVLPDAIKNDVTLHGASTLYVKTNNGVKDVTLEVPVLILTSWISSVSDFLAVAHNLGNTTYGYYKLASDLNLNGSDWTEFVYGNPTPTFSGILDGNGKTITTKSRQYGIFHTLREATIRNVTFKDAWAKCGCEQYTSILSLDMFNSTIENCTFEVTAKSGAAVIKTPFAISEQGYGWVNSRVCHTNSFKDCTFNASTVATPVQTLLGTHSSCVNITFANSTFTCDSYYCLYQSQYTNLVTTTSEGLTITGTCVYSA